MNASAIVFTVLLAGAGLAAGAQPVVLNPDGAWCWFQDERALVYDGKLTAGSITHTGDVQVTTWDLRQGVIGIKTLHPKLEADDHDVPGLLLRNDGRLMAFYTTHGGIRGKYVMYYRVSARAREAREWEPEQTFNAGLATGFTYANPFQLRKENGRIYFFWRAKDWNPTWTASDDNGKTWSPGANVIYYQANERPYVKYASNGVDTVHFVFTEGHPDRPYRTNLYHAYYRNSGLYRSDGTFLHKLADGPVKTTEATRIYDGSSETGEAWVWDVHLDRGGRPVVAYSSHVSPMDHRYRYARWNGKSWEDHQVGYAGKRLYEQERSYSGGIALDPDDLNTVYASADVRLEDGKPNGSGHYELYKGVTRDGGKTWRWQPLTAGSTRDNLRPIVPAGHPGKTFVLWFRGKYSAYTRFETEIVALTDANLPPLRDRVSWDGN